MKRIHRTTLVVLVLILCHSMASAKTDDLQSTLEEALFHQDVPALQVSIIFPSGELWSGAAGAIDRQGEIPLETFHILRMGSVSKLYTATLIMILIQEGLLCFEDPLSRWLPDFPGSQEVTVHMLLNHTSGIFNYTEDIFRFMFLSFITRNIEPQNLIDIAGRKEYYHQPGTDQRYSNTNYVLLGMIASEVTGLSMEELLQKKIFHPLGLHSTYLLPRELVPEHLIDGFDRDLIPFGTQRIAPDNRPIPAGAFTAGAMASTSSDLAIFLEALFSGALIGEEMIAEMMRLDHVPGSDYGLGMYTVREKGMDFWGHGGAIPGFEAVVFHAPAEQYTVAVMGNVSIFDAHQVFSQLLFVLLE